MKITPRVSPFLAWGDFHARSRFTRSTILEEKWWTARSLKDLSPLQFLLIFFASLISQSLGKLVHVQDMLKVTKLKQLVIGAADRTPPSPPPLPPKHTPVFSGAVEVTESIKHSVGAKLREKTHQPYLDYWFLFLISLEKFVCCVRSL